MRRRGLLPQTTLDRFARDFEIDIFEAALRSRPEHLPTIEALANAYVRSERYGDALRLDRRMCALLPENPIAHYNLACTLSLANDVEASIGALARAIDLGYSDFRYIARDPDLANARRDARFDALLRKRGPRTAA